MSNRYRYAFWDGTQVLPALDADTVMSAIADDLLNHGDLEHALRSLMQRGIRSPERNMRGLTDFVRQLREERRKRLEQFNLGGVMEDIERQLKEIVTDERSSVDNLRKQAADEQAQQQQNNTGGSGSTGRQRCIHAARSFLQPDFTRCLCRRYSNCENGR